MPAADASRIALRGASLFDVDPEMAELLDERRAAQARPHAIVPVATLPAGPLYPLTLARLSSRPFALMVVEGVLLREIRLGRSPAGELLGPTDIVDTGARPAAMFEVETVWSVPDTATVAVLDDRLLPILRLWPGAGRILLARSAQREARVSTHRAIAQLPRIDQRLLALFGYLAERWGRVSPDGLIVPLDLTHETLGRLIGGRRPTVSLAIKELASAGVLLRRADGSWVVQADAVAELRIEAPGWQPADARRAAQSIDADMAGDAGARPAIRSSAEERADLRARIERLRTEHAGRVTHTTTVLERSRANRRGRGFRRGVA
jgi:CRP/FNR family transcriptional regulator, cyclic AMP receptor protein